MERYFLAFLCSSGGNLQTIEKCQEVVKITVKNFQIYQTLKEKEKKYQKYAENKLTKPGFWALTTTISSISTKTLYFTGHNLGKIDSFNLKVGETSEIGITIAF